MKKIKFLPSVLMLVLSIAVLALGVYAANPSTNTVTGSIKVNASAYPIAVKCLLNDEQIDSYPTIRAGITWTKALSELQFKTDTALTLEEVHPIKLTLEIQNLSNVDLGAYFLTDESTLSDGKATLNSISTVEHLVSGTDTVVKASKTGYTKLEPNQTVQMTVSMALYKFFYEDIEDVEFTYILNIEECQDALVSMKQGVTVNTNNNPNVTVSPIVMHGYTNENLNAEGQEKAESEKMVSLASTGRYSTTNLAIDDDNYINENLSSYKRYRTTNVKFTIYNDEDYGITADINAVLDEANVQVTTLGNAYIGAKKTGEVSLQFTPLRDSNVTVSAVINDVVSKIDIYKATNEVAAEADVYSRIKYNAQGYNGGTMKHYIEYGVNPFNPSQKLKWYVWGVEDDGAVRALTADEIASSQLATGKEYYFIAENLLDISADKDYGKDLMYNNENCYAYGNVDATETKDYYASKYEGSLLQGYLSGTTMRTNNTFVTATGSNGHIATGATANFYDYYGLTNDPIYNQISGRELSEMYSSDSSAPNGGSYNSKYDGMSDKFWTLSYSEYSLMRGKGYGDIDNGYSYSNTTAYQLSTGKIGMGGYWWLRSPDNDSEAATVRNSGDGGCEFVDTGVGIRPAFKLAV